MADNFMKQVAELAQEELEKLRPLIEIKVIVDLKIVHYAKKREPIPDELLDQATNNMKAILIVLGAVEDPELNDIEIEVVKDS